MRILDLFSGAGGAAMGYHRAFPDAEIVGVDIAPQPNYPFGFTEDDALSYLRYNWTGFDLIHASPPCQAYSSATLDPSRHPDLYAVTRSRLVASGVPWVIEKANGAPYGSGIVLCGSMFGLGVQRHRNFETSFLMMQPHHDHRDFTSRPYTVTGHLHRTEQDYPHSLKPARDHALELMGVPWMTWQECVLAIPPAYTEYIGAQFAATAGAAA